jgi:hypothetical protein
VTHRVRTQQRAPSGELPTRWLPCAHERQPGARRRHCRLHACKLTDGRYPRRGSRRERTPAPPAPYGSPGRRRRRRWVRATRQPRPEGGRLSSSQADAGVSRISVGVLRRLRSRFILAPGTKGGLSGRSRCGWPLGEVAGPASCDCCPDRRCWGDGDSSNFDRGCLVGASHGESQGVALDAGSASVCPH